MTNTVFDEIQDVIFDAGEETISMPATTVPMPTTTTPTSTVPMRCQVRWQCPDKCCPPTRCPDPAQFRVTFHCASPTCDHAGDLLLMCESCTGQADTLGPVLARRPL